MLTRRAVLEGAAAVAVTAAVGGVSVAFAGEGDLLRPPGAQDEGSLLGACVRCDRCRSACPRDAIDVATVEDGLVNARTPKMNFRKGYCDACDGAYRCRAACPTGAIGAFDPDAQAIGKAVIDADECLTYGISATCDARCVDACPVDALSVDARTGRLQIDERLCWGCGICELVCPSDAYGVYSGSGRRGINVEYRKAGGDGA